MLVSPIWKKYRVSAPLGLTLPLSVAVKGVRLVTPPVTATGWVLDCACAAAGAASAATASKAAKRVAWDMDLLPFDGRLPRATPGTRAAMRHGGTRSPAGASRGGDPAGPAGGSVPA